MIVDFDFEFKDKVKILPFNAKGRVVSMKITPNGKMYEVRYFINSKVETTFFYEDEIQKLKPPA